ncbi:MAG: methylenetetrahydrofolate reductase [Lachnospiraceae bacterium]|nr:methylenetetrahydrofolate reductase [NAD(P)H] [Lachnospiraceae bacterium]
MKIREVLAEKRPTLSFEVFPPKKEEQFASVEGAAMEIAALRPDFMSVTYGAGGGTSRYTAQLSADLQQQCGVPALAHLTCVTSTRDRVREVLKDLKEKGIENVLALRGDIPEDGKTENEYRYAAELVREIRAFDETICIGAACYPEGHVESASQTEDLKHLKEKIDVGVDFVTTQMFFDNNRFFHFLYRLRDMGVTTPVIAGIMPITNVSMMKRVRSLSGATLPRRFTSLLDRFADKPAAMEQAGILYATEQIVDLIANDVNGIHIYTMNKPHVAKRIQEEISLLL